MDVYSVYVLYSEVYNKIYIGYTSNLIHRFYSHNIYSKGGWTVKYRPWIVACVELFDTRQDTMIREKQLKTAKGREFIWSYIKNNYICSCKNGGVAQLVRASDS